MYKPFPAKVYLALSRLTFGARRYRRKKEKIRRRYGDLFQRVSSILRKHDPISLVLSPDNEYDFEVVKILPRMKYCSSVEEVTKMVHHVFVETFDADSAGPSEKYHDLSHEIWELWSSNSKQ